ncbi:hypothetical protein PoB_007115900 [Plakobranchus ocellatus]|uniref:Uncharacterized protein n=1 Tax=Plakobranchus ocellatus TaxID=259542 RepID=A0AAV4DKT2_9GAST|nr:hypothetical protein PoB_007115900 [Plakobranchus ocellatus]
MDDYKKEIIELVTVSMANEVMEANSGLRNDNDFIWCNSHRSLKDLKLACQYSKRVFNSSTSPRVFVVVDPPFCIKSSCSKGFHQIRFQWECFVSDNYVWDLNC